MSDTGDICRALEAQGVPFEYLEEPRTLELEGGQIVLASDVQERGGQLVLEELAPDPEPAPLNHTPEHPADDMRLMMLRVWSQKEA